MLCGAFRHSSPRMTREDAMKDLKRILLSARTRDAILQFLLVAAFLLLAIGYASLPIEIAAALPSVVLVVVAIAVAAKQEIGIAIYRALPIPRRKP